MHSLLLVLLGLGLAAAPATPPKKGAVPKATKALLPAKAKAPKVPPAVVDEPLSPEAQKRVALVEPTAVKKVSRPALKKVMAALEADLRDQGFDTIPAAQVTAQHLKRRMKVPACGDAPDCLAKVGKVAGAGYVANVSITPAGKNLGVKLTLVDTADAKIVANRMGFVPKPTAEVLVEAVKKQVPRVAEALSKRIAEKEALAAAASVVVVTTSEPPKPAEPTPAEPAPAKLVAPAGEGPQPIATVTAVTPAEPEPAPAKLAPEPEPELARAPLVPAPAAQLEGSTRSPRVLPWIAMGVGAAAVGVGVGYFGMQARGAADDFKAGNDALAARDRAKSRALLADITTGAGAAMVLVGAGVLVFGGLYSGELPPAVQPSVAITPDGAAVALSGSF